MGTEDTIVLQAEMTDATVAEWFGKDAFFDWMHAPEDQQLRFFLKKDAVECGASSEKEIEEMTVGFMRMLTDKGIPFTVRNYKNELPNGLFFRRMIKMGHTNNLNSVQ